MNYPVQSPWMDAKKAAEYAGRTSKNSYRWIIRLAKHGILKGDGVGFDGKNWTFKPEAIDRWKIANAKKIQEAA